MKVDLFYIVAILGMTFLCFVLPEKSTDIVLCVCVLTVLWVIDTILNIEIEKEDKKK